MNKKSGITLIALIITIIIMLILVAVTISIVINSGIIGKAQKAKQDTQSAYEQESRLGDSINVDGVIYNSIDEYIAKEGDSNLPKLQEFFAKGWDAISVGQPGLESFTFKHGVEPIPDADTTLVLLHLPSGDGSWVATVLYENHIYWVNGGWVNGVNNEPLSITNGDTLVNKALVFGEYIGQCKDASLLNGEEKTVVEYNNSIYLINSYGALDITDSNYIIYEYNIFSDDIVTIYPESCITWQDVIDSQVQAISLFVEEYCGTECVFYAPGTIIKYSGNYVLPEDSLVRHGRYVVEDIEL